MPADLAELAVQALVRANHEALESHALARAPLNVAQQRAGKVVIGARPRPPALPPTLPRAPMRSRFRQRFMLA
ncbi:MAG: hypothetical protein JJT95_13190 [Pararhodobacter sp.]|nr:hypothetical protein [Pararhodobacter sp.]